MKRRQIQFESDQDREDEINRHVSRFLQGMFVLALFVLLLVFIGLSGAHGQEIDNYCDMVLRHWTK